MNPSHKSAAPLATRHYVLAGSLAATLTACMWTWTTEQANEDDMAVVPARASRASPKSPVAGRPADPTRATTTNPWTPVERGEWAPPVSLAGWAPPPPPPPPQAAPSPPPAPPAPPRAPAFGWQILGILDDGVPKVLLTSPTNTLAAKVGDVIEAQWRIEKITPTGLHLTWVPGDQPQTISFRSNP